jgi:hypothetical protein
MGWAEASAGPKQRRHCATDSCIRAVIIPEEMIRFVSSRAPQKELAVRIALLEIANYRGVRDGKVQFRDHTVIIGPNNSGKTTIIEALALVLGRDRLVRNLTEHDFFGSDPQPADRIRIVATITGFEPEDLMAHPDWFRSAAACRFGLTLGQRMCSRKRD